MRKYISVLALIVAVVAPGAALAKGRAKKSKVKVPAGWKAIDESFAYRTQFMSGANPFCDVHIMNLTPKWNESVDIEFAYLNPRSGTYINQRRPSREKIGPGQFLYQEDWRVPTADCKNITVRVMSSRFRQ